MTELAASYSCPAPADEDVVPSAVVVVEPALTNALVWWKVIY